MNSHNCIKCKNCDQVYIIEDKDELNRLNEKPFFCNSSCKKIFHFNNKWKSKEYEPNPKNLKGISSTCIDRAMFNKKYVPSLKFKACRG
jgi:hypothetical protein